MFRKKFSWELGVHKTHLTTLKTDVSTAHNQVQLLSKNYDDVVAMVTARLKQRLAENEAMSVEKMSQLQMQCGQLSQDREDSEAESKRLVDAIQLMESQLQQSEETNKSITSKLQGELNGINKCSFLLLYDCVCVCIVTVHL